MISRNRLYLQLKVFDYITRFELDLQGDGKFSQRNTVEITSEELSSVFVNKLRVHYFFTENYEIEKFVDETESELRITDGPEWASVLAVGSSLPFKYFTSKDTERVQRQ